MNNKLYKIPDLFILRSIITTKSILRRLLGKPKGGVTIAKFNVVTIDGVNVFIFQKSFQRTIKLLFYYIFYNHCGFFQVKKEHIYHFQSKLCADILKLGKAPSSDGWPN